MTQEQKNELIVLKQNEIENIKNLVVVKQQLKQGLENSLIENLTGFSIKTSDFSISINSENYNVELKNVINLILLKLDIEISETTNSIAQPLVELENQLVLINSEVVTEKSIEDLQRELLMKQLADLDNK